MKNSYITEAFLSGMECNEKASKAYAVESACFKAYCAGALINENYSNAELVSINVLKSYVKVTLRLESKTITLYYNCLEGIISLSKPRITMPNCSDESLRIINIVKSLKKKGYKNVSRYLVEDLIETLKEIK